MFRHGEISTEIEKKPFVVTLAVLVISVLAAILILALSHQPLAVFAAVLLLIMAICCGLVIFGMMSDYCYIDGEKLYMHYLFKGSNIALKDIGYISLKDNVYSVFDRKENKVGTINALALGIDEILHKLNTSKVLFK